MLKRLLINKPTNKIPLKVCWAILQGAKRGCAEVTTEFVEAALDKHKNALTDEKAPLDPDIKEVFRQKFRNIFRAKQYTRYCNGTKYTCFNVREFTREEGNPGPNACYERPRSEYGRAGYVRERWQKHLEDNLCLKEGDLLGIHIDATTGKSYEEKYSKNLLPRIPHSFLVREALATLEKQNGICHATVVECLEPLKCRLITKGNAMPYAAVMPFQKDMRRHLYDKHFAFKLIGEPLTEQLLHELLAKERRANIFADDVKNGKVIKWNSGDFSAATDGISQEVNSLALEEYIASLAGVTEDEKTILRAVLGNHLLNYPDDENRPYKVREPFMMKNGQLMGCPISFPILCAINLAAYWLALEEYTGRKFEIDKLPVLINGDDILFRATDEMAAIWHKWITHAGFTLSKGKNYLAKDFLTVNSVCYSYRSQEYRQSQAKLAKAVAKKNKTSKTYVPKGCAASGASGLAESTFSSVLVTDDGEESADENNEPESKPTIDVATEFGTNLSDSFTKIGYLNTGLLYQNQTMKWKGWQHGCRSELRQKPFADKLNDLLDNCCDKKRTFALAKKHYAIEIAQATERGNLSLTAHPSLGGVGVNPKGIEEEVFYTPFQRKLGGFLKDRLKKGNFGRHPTQTIGGTEIVSSVVDLNKNLDIEGRVTYRNDAITIAKVPADLCFGDVVMRRVDEPMREHEQRVKDLHNTNALYNYQAPLDRKKMNLTWTQGYLPTKVLKEFRGTKHPVELKNPSNFHLEARCKNLYRTDSQFVWEVEINHEDGTVQKYQFLPGVHQELDPLGMSSQQCQIQADLPVGEAKVDYLNTSSCPYTPFCTFGARGTNSPDDLVQSATKELPPIDQTESIAESDIVEESVKVLEC